ncbi:MAG: hypothetical protein OXH61_14205 [Acidimicrobiaceae bacterium]|nr:hypothetical protein [Acidimicrobiaceae bacterium]
MDRSPATVTTLRLGGQQQFNPVGEFSRRESRYLGGAVVVDESVDWLAEDAVALPYRIVGVGQVDQVENSVAPDEALKIGF